mgnify:CR=1 FL=1
MNKELYFRVLAVALVFALKVLIVYLAFSWALDMTMDRIGDLLEEIRNAAPEA